MVEVTKREIGTMLQPAPAFAYQGVWRLSSVFFSWVIVGLLEKAVAPKLEHLRVLADGEPRSSYQYWEADEGQNAKTNEENRYRDKDNNHPRRQFQAGFCSGSVHRLIDR